MGRNHIAEFAESGTLCLHNVLHCGAVLLAITFSSPSSPTTRRARLWPEPHTATELLRGSHPPAALRTALNTSMTRARSKPTGQDASRRVHMQARAASPARTSSLSDEAILPRSIPHRAVAHALHSTLPSTHRSPHLNLYTGEEGRFELRRARPHRRRHRLPSAPPSSRT